jgi:hypothetical protein
MFTITEMIVGLWFFPVVLCIVTPLAMLAVWSMKQAVKKVTASILQQEGDTVIGFQPQSAS